MWMPAIGYLLSVFISTIDDDDFLLNNLLKNKHIVKLARGMLSYGHNKNKKAHPITRTTRSDSDTIKTSRWET